MTIVEQNGRLDRAGARLDLLSLNLFPNWPARDLRPVCLAELP